jgi:hypothetical protein
VIRVVVPKDLDDEDKDAVRKLAEKHPINARADIRW